MKNVLRRDMRVFEFNEEDKLADLASAVQLRKFKNPAHLKYDFHDHIYQGNKVQPKNITCVPCVDVDVINCDVDSIDMQPQDGVGQKLNNREIQAEFEDASVTNSMSLPNNFDRRTDDHMCRNTTAIDEKVPAVGVSSPGVIQSEFVLSDSPTCDIKVNLNSDDDASTSGSRPSSYDYVDPENDSLNDNECFGSSKSNEGVATSGVVLYPDYVIYQDNYYIGPELIFSRSCIKINCLLDNGTHGTLIFERAIDDLVDIKCRLYQDVETVMIILHAISTNVVQLDNTCGTLGIEELKIAVVEPNWSLKHRQITSLNVKYLAIWNDALEAEMGAEGDESPMQRQYFPTFDEPFDEVIYPKGDSDAVSLSKRDIDVLQPNTFINDTVIDFYIKYLKNQIPPEEIHRFHFFNSFFFRKLADLDKHPSSAFDGKAAFIRVRKWTSKVDLFEKDYIFIPVNFRLHWSLIVICHPGEVIHSFSEDLNFLSKVPCILHMDSIKGSHSGLKNLVQSYLCEEWKERQKEAPENRSSRFLNMRFLSLELPQQENLYDCGLFLLHYLELFLAEAPLSFNPFKITKFTNFLNADWFPPAEASLKRTLIQRLIFQLLQNRSLQVSSSDHNDDHRSTEYVMNKNSDTSMEFFSERFFSEIKENPTHSSAGDGIHMTLLSAASSLDPRSVNSSGMVIREHFDAGATASSLINTANLSTTNHLECPETGDQYMHLTTGDTNTEQMDGTTSLTCAWPFRTSTVPEIAEHDEHDTSEDTSDCASNDSEGIKIMQTNPTVDSLGPLEVKRDARNYVPKQNTTCLSEITGSAFTNLAIASQVEGSQDSSKKNSDSSLQIASYSSKDIELLSEDEPMIEDDLSPTSHQGQATKRMRLTPPIAILSEDSQ